MATSDFYTMYVNSTSTTGSNDPWYSWISSTSSVTATTYTWRSWTNDVQQWQTPPSRSQEEEAREQAEVAAREQARRAESALAGARAEALLVTHLNAEQRAAFAKDRTFVVHGRSARYRIHCRRTGNIEVVTREGFVSHRLCAHPSEWVPDEDTMLAQKLALECNEDEFLRIANRHPAFDRNQRVLPTLQ